MVYGYSSFVEASWKFLITAVFKEGLYGLNTPPEMLGNNFRWAKTKLMVHHRIHTTTNITNSKEQKTVICIACKRIKEFVIVTTCVFRAVKSASKYVCGRGSTPDPAGGSLQVTTLPQTHGFTVTHERHAYTPWLRRQFVFVFAWHMARPISILPPPNLNWLTCRNQWNKARDHLTPRAVVGGPRRYTALNNFSQITSSVCPLLFYK